MDISTAAEARIAVPAEEAARLVSVSRRHWYYLVAQGRVPEPVKFGGSVRWIVADLRRWAADGCPPVNT